MGADVVGGEVLLLPVFKMEGSSGGTLVSDREVSIEVVTDGFVCQALDLKLALAGLGGSMRG